MNGDNMGLYQISWPWHLDELEQVTGSRDPMLLLDADVNEAVARLIYAADGNSWRAWSCTYAAEER